MAEVADAAPLASFEAKWAAAHPEFGLALRFVPAGQRVAQSAFACLVYELEHAAFGIREAQPAAIKLQWWGEEFARAGKHEARHPLTQALAEHPGFAAIPLVRWYEVIAGALAQRDPEPAADGESLIDHYAQLYAPLGVIEAELFGGDAKTTAGALSLARALRETASLSSTLRNGTLPLPLDLLARYRLARGDLAEASPARCEALREWLRRLAGEMRGLLMIRVAIPEGVRLGVLRSAMIAADRTRALQAARASDPLAAMTVALDRLSFAAVWAAWRAARRSRWWAQRRARHAC
ncbi:MAG: squalene/phytoene synthase family protein [Lysobacterales bacterium]